jgi:hypothetical protein
VGELESESVMCCVLFCRISCLPPFLVPCGGGVRLPFIGKERANHIYAALLSYMGKCGVLCRRVGGRLDGPCRDPAIMAYLVPEQ